MNRIGITLDTPSYVEEKGMYSDGLEWKIKGTTLAQVGTLDPALCKHFDLKLEVYYAQINWDLCLELLASREQIQYKAVSKFPAVRRDLALLVDQQVTFADIKGQALKAENKILKSVGLFDVYEGKELPQGKKSYAVHLTLQDEGKTLTDKQIDKSVQRITQRLQNELKAELR